MTSFYMTLMYGMTNITWKKLLEFSSPRQSSSGGMNAHRQWQEVAGILSAATRRLVTAKLNQDRRLSLQG